MCCLSSRPCSCSWHAGTLRQLHNLQAAEAKAKAEEATEDEQTRLLEIPRGKYQELDQLDDVRQRGRSLRAARRPPRAGA